MVLFILLILLGLIYKNILQRHITKPQEYFNIRSLDIIVKNGWMKNICAILR